MGTQNQPFGLRAVYHPSGQVRTYALNNGITSGYATTLLQGAPVKLVNGVVNLAAAGDSFVGCFQGVTYADPATGRTIITNRWLASTTYTTTSGVTPVVNFTRDPTIVYEVQLGGTATQGDIGTQVNFNSNTGTGNTTTGLSAAYADATFNSTRAQLEIMDIAPYADNAWGDQYPIVRVTIALHQDVAGHDSY